MHDDPALRDTREPSHSRGDEIQRGAWMRLPSGNLVEVCKITGPERPEVALRHLDGDGVMSTGYFLVTLTWLARYGSVLQLMQPSCGDGVSA